MRGVHYALLAVGLRRNAGAGDEFFDGGAYERETKGAFEDDGDVDGWCGIARGRWGEDAADGRSTLQL